MKRKIRKEFLVTITSLSIVIVTFSFLLYTFLDITSSKEQHTMKKLYSETTQIEENNNQNALDAFNAGSDMTEEFENRAMLLATGTVFTATTGGRISSGTYYLDKNITLTGQMEIASGANVVIDLNGHVLQKNGGFIAIVGGTLTIIDSNPSTTHYGTVTNGIWTYKSSATSGVAINGGIITGATGDRGGAFLVRGELILEGGTIAGTVAQETDPNQTNVIHQPTGGAGGAIFIDQGGKYIMNGGAIKYCSSDPDIISLGGAVFIDAEKGSAGQFIMNGGTIANCKSSTGGAVYVHEALEAGITSNAVFEMNGGSISDNNITLDSAGHGGGVYVQGTFEMNGGTIDNNGTYKTGETLDNLPVYAGYGGGVYTQTSTATFTMNGGIISNNKAASGGGIMVWNDSTFIMNGGTISGNVANGQGGQGNGGAVYVQTALFDFNKGTLENNIARRYGGAININQSSTLNLDGECKILNNVANDGGGISQEDGECAIKLDNEGILISENEATTGNGGGLFIEKGTLNITKGTISKNKAGQNGGGISLHVSRIGGDITLNMNGGTIAENKSGTHGGGINIFADHTTTGGSTGDTTNDVVVNLNAGTINENMSDGEGGGLHVWTNEENGTATMNIGKSGNTSGPLVKNNSSKTNGGAISLYSGTIDMYGGSINENTTNNNGGGIYIGGTGRLTLNNGMINKNVSTSGNGGGIYIASGNITINDGDITENKCTNSSNGSGGGICVANGSITMNDGNIEKNEAINGGGFYLTKGKFEIKNGSRISENKAVNGAGGYVAEGTFNLTGGVTSNNIATEKGGGYYIIDTPTAALTNGIISDNEAKHGGGFYQTQTNNKETLTTLSGTCYVNNNTAKNGNGGGIYVDGGSTFRITSGKVVYNSATGKPNDTDFKSYVYHDKIQTEEKSVYAKDSSAGVGGGVYIKNGTFTMKEKSGTDGTAAIFGNTADYAADDLFAYGNGLTTFDAIPVTIMEKDDAYLNSTDWFEDYIKGEYHKSLKIEDNGKYITADNRYKNIISEDLLISADSVLNTSNDYICITMGANVGNIGIKIDDSYVGIDNTFIFILKDEDEEITMNISVKKEKETTIVNLPIGAYTLTLKDNWSWRYQNEFKTTIIKGTDEKVLEESNQINFNVTGGQTTNINTKYSIKNKKFLTKNLYSKLSPVNYALNINE